MLKTLAVDGCEIVFREEGSGRPIIIIGGGPGLSSEYLTPLFALRDKHRMILFDQPGCGLSTTAIEPTAILTVEATAKLINLVAAGSNYSIIAHSWGAYLAAQACLKLGYPPAQTILLNPVPFDRHGFDVVGTRLVSRVEQDVMTRIGQLMGEKTVKAGREIMQLALPAYCGRIDNLPRVALEYSISTSESVTASLGNYNNHAAINHMGQITMVFGTTDYILMSDFGEELSLTNNSTLAGGHFSILDAPDEVLSIVKDAIGT